MKHVRMDLSCFGDSFGVETKIFAPLFLPPPVLKKLSQETFCRLELCTLLFWGSLRGTGHAVLDVNWDSPGGKGEESSWPGLSRLSPSNLSEEARFADVLGV